MPLKRKVNCKTCVIITAEAEKKKGGDFRETRLYKLIDDAHMKKTSFQSIADAYPQIGYAALRNHAKKHQHPSEKALAKNAVRETVIKQRQTELTKIKHHTERRSQIMDWIEEKIAEGEVKPTAAAIVALLKQEADIEEKQKDRTHELQKLFGGYLANPLPPDPKWFIEGEIVESNDVDADAA